MASVEDIKQELAKTEKQLEKAEAAQRKFEEGEDGQWLAELKRKLRNDGGTPAQQQRWEKEKIQLEKRQERLEQDVRDRLEHVEELQKALTTTTQPGNDFVTRALGT